MGHTCSIPKSTLTEAKKGSFTIDFSPNPSPFVYQQRFFFNQPSPPSSPSDFSKKLFTGNEIAILNSQFACLMAKWKDDVALTIHSSISENIDDAIAKYHAMRRSQPNSRKGELGLGLTVLNGIEKVLSRMDDQKSLENFCKRLLRNHGDHLGVNKELMIASLSLAEEVMLEDSMIEFMNFSPDLSHKDSKNLWRKFFIYCRHLFQDN